MFSWTQNLNNVNQVLIDNLTFIMQTQFPIVCDIHQKYSFWVVLYNLSIFLEHPIVETK